MRSAVVIAVSLLWSSIVMADVPNQWLVSIAGSNRAYLCSECGLEIPSPDLASAQALNAWKLTQPPFDGPVDEKGVYHPIKSGDQVSLCNQSGCSTYTWQDSVGWTHGVFQHQESHGPRSSS